MKRPTVFALVLAVAFFMYYFHGEINDFIDFVDAQVITPYEVVWHYVFMGGIVFLSIWTAVIIKWFAYEPWRARKIIREREEEMQKETEKKMKKRLGLEETAIQDCFIMFLLENAKKFKEAEADAF